MSSRRPKLLARVNWYLQSSLKQLTEYITGNRLYYRGGRYRQVSLYLNQWWSNPLIHICVSRPQWVKSDRGTPAIYQPGPRSVVSLFFCKIILFLVRQIIFTMITRQKCFSNKVKRTFLCVTILMWSLCYQKQRYRAWKNNYIPQHSVIFNYWSRISCLWIRWSLISFRACCLLGTKSSLIQTALFSGGQWEEKNLSGISVK